MKRSVDGVTWPGPFFPVDANASGVLPPVSLVSSDYSVAPPEPQITTLNDSGIDPANTLNLVFISEGYLESELTDFQDLVERVSNTFRIVNPFSKNLDTFQEFGLPPELDGADPSKVYQKVTGIRPNQYQRGQLKASIFDTNIWYSAITHWQLHGWNPKNVHGIYELYQRGGAPGCRYCSKERDSQDETLSVIQKMREEYRSRNYGNH